MSPTDRDARPVVARRRVARDVLLIVAFSLALRIAFFSGYGLGDDFSYADAVHQILNHGYPAPPEPNVFLLRPAFLQPIATSVRWLGWSELAFVVPVLLASLVGIACAYLLGLTLHSRAAGWFAALALSLAPLDLVNASTLTNDIVGSAFLGAGCVLLMAAFSEESSRPRLLAALGAFVFGLSTSVKLSFVVASIPLGLSVAWAVWHERTRWRLGAVVAGGFTAAQLALLGFCLLKFGNLGAPLDVELEFNYGAMERHYSPEMLRDTLLYYPRMIVGLRPAGHYGHEIFPLGWFYLLGLIAAVRVPFLGDRSARGPWLFFVFLMLAMEFWPLRVEPYYVPIHRLPRFLHIAAIPGAILIGIGCAELWKRKLEWKLALLLACVFYATTSLATASRASAHHNDAMRDLRLIAETLQYSTGVVVSDVEARTYLLFADEFRAPLRYLLNPETNVPSGSLVVVGGSRRPEVGSAPAFPEERVPPQWIEVANFGGDPAPWRATPARIYAVPR